MNNSAQPAEMRASLTRGTVKKRVMTCGRPAVPTISDRVMKNTSTTVFAPRPVYAAKPSS